MRKVINTIQEKDILLWVNVSLIGVTCLLFVYYIMMANSIASRSYKTQVLHDTIEELSEKNSVLMSKKMVLETPASLLDFARSQQLVEAKNISYIFEGRNVARR